MNSKNTDQKATACQKAPTDTERRHAFIAKHGVTGGTLESRQAQHSPLPWSADKWATGYTVSATDHSVCHLQDCNNDEANAKLIVASVNHADKLAEALRAWEYAGNEGGISMVDWFEVARKKTRAALAEYEKSKPLTVSLY